MWAGFAIFSLFSNWKEKRGENDLENKKVKSTPFFLSFTFNNKGMVITSSLSFYFFILFSKHTSHDEKHIFYSPFSIFPTKQSHINIIKTMCVFCTKINIALSLNFGLECLTLKPELNIYKPTGTWSLYRRRKMLLLFTRYIADDPTKYKLFPLSA